MYTGRGFIDWGMGDIDVLKVEDTYHLFHLVLPNHDYIAHAVSKDGLGWRRVRNALFVGDPGRWDDDMLWTMHVTEDPERTGEWRMFYTGLCRRERGRVQRIGLARSSDLFHWTKVDEGYPIESKGVHYEEDVNEGRNWVSFRDPLFVRAGDERWILVAARVRNGPLVRRGCVGLVKETEPGSFHHAPPLHHPGLYDDVEVPGLVGIGGRWYLLGSIREDVKVHYWHADSPEGPYGNFHDNVLLPQGNYAARVCRDGERLLVWNYFFSKRTRAVHDNRLPPPKELVVDGEGRLRLRSFHGFDDEVTRRLDRELTPVRPGAGNEAASVEETGDGVRFGCPHAWEAVFLQGEYRNFRFRCRLEMSGRGKCGFLFRSNADRDGYYLSLDLYQGLAQIRAWGREEGGTFENAFRYDQLQAANFACRDGGPYRVELLAFGSYLELSLDGYVVLSLADDVYREGRLGFYVESGRVRASEMTLEEMAGEREEEYGEVM